MIIKYSKYILSEKFHSLEMDTDEFRKMLEDFVSEQYPKDEIDAIEINDNGLVEIKLKSGEEIEIDVDWNELVLK